MPYKIDKKLSSFMKTKYNPRVELTLGDAIAELKSLVSELSTFSIVSPSSKDMVVLKNIVAIVEGISVPELVGKDLNVEA